MTVPVASPAVPAQPASDRPPAAKPQDSRRATRFAALLGPARRRAPAGDDEPRRGPATRHRRGGLPGEDDGAPEGGLDGAALLGVAAGAASAARGSAPAGPPSAPAGDDGVARALEARLVESLQVGAGRDGQAEVRFDVADGALKGLEVRLRATPEGVEATFLAEDAAARRGLAEPLLELQQALAARGVTVARLEVAVRADVGGRGARRGPEDDAVAGCAAASRTAAGAGRLPVCRARSATDWVA